MQAGNNQENLHASILDRLVDFEPQTSHESVQYRLLNIGQIKKSVIRDLENLLNARRCIISPPASFKELNNSLFVYGLRDFTSSNPNSQPVRVQLRQDVEKTIARFEPRLKNVSVRFENASKKDRAVRFRISAMLVVEPITEPVSFDTLFDINRTEYTISG